MQRVRGEHGGMPVSRRHTTELRLELSRTDPCGLEDRGSIRQLGDRCGGPRALAALATRAPTPQQGPAGGRRGAGGTAPRTEGAPPARASGGEEGAALQGAAGGPPRRAAEGAGEHWAATGFISQVLLEEV